MYKHGEKLEEKLACCAITSVGELPSCSAFISRHSIVVLIYFFEGFLHVLLFSYIYVLNIQKI